MPPGRFHSWVEKPESETVTVCFQPVFWAKGRAGRTDHSLSRRDIAGDDGPGPNFRPIANPQGSVFASDDHCPGSN